MVFFNIRKKLLEAELKRAEVSAEKGLKRARQEAEVLKRKQAIHAKQFEAKKIREAELEKLRKQITGLKGKSITPAQKASIEKRKKFINKTGKAIGKGAIATFKFLDKITDERPRTIKKPSRVKKRVVRKKPVRRTKRRVVKKRVVRKKPIRVKRRVIKKKKSKAEDYSFF